MPVLTAGPNTIFLTLYFGTKSEWLIGNVSGLSSTGFTVDRSTQSSGSTATFFYTGTGFGAPGPDGVPTTGTITSIIFKQDGVDIAVWTGISVPISIWRTFIASGSEPGVVDLFFGGSDEIVGGDIADGPLGLGDAIGGFGGNDRLYGNGGSDRVDGGAGSDAVDGGSGNDAVLGGTGGDALFGGLGDDLVYHNVDLLGVDDGAVDALVGGDGNDQIFVGQGDSADGGAGFDRVFVGLESLSAAVNLNLATNFQTTLAGLIGGSLNNFEAFSIYGTRFNDVITGDAQNNQLYGGLGADTLNGGDGNDTLWHSDNGVEGLAFIDSDIDRLNGGNGADVIYLGLGDFADGGNGFDRAFVSFAGRSTALDLNLIGNIEATLEAAAGVTLSFFEEYSLYGTAFDDVVISDAGNQRVFGGAGNNTITTGAGDDFLSGDYGNDTLNGGAGEDLFYYVGGADVLIGGDDNDTFNFGSSLASQDIRASTVTIRGDGGVDAIDLTRIEVGLTIDLTLTALQSIGFGTLTVSGIEILNGGIGADRFTGGAEANTFRGNGGNDILTGGGGADTLTGGSGADVFRYLAASDSTAAVQDIITDFQVGTDRIDLTALNPISVSVARLAGGGSVVFAETANGLFQLFAANANLTGADFIYTAPIGVYAIGSDEADDLSGSVIADPIVGGAGDDVLTGLGGADAIAGGTGRDIFRYTSVSDSNQTTGFDNLYDFVTGEDRIDLTPLNPTSISILRSDNGSSFVYAETPGGSFLTTAAGRAVNGSDIMYAGGFGIYMVGAGAADTLIGTSRADPIAGGGGNDTIIGGGGADALFGDAGADTFVYRTASDSTAAASDGIFGFVSGEDKVDLRLIRTSSADTYGIAYLAGGSFIFVDLGGNGSTDMVIGLAGTTLRDTDIRWLPGSIGEEPEVKDNGPDVLPIEDVEGLDGLGDLAAHSGRFMLDLDPAAGGGFHGSPDWYL